MAAPSQILLQPMMSQSEPQALFHKVESSRPSIGVDNARGYSTATLLLAVCKLGLFSEVARIDSDAHTATNPAGVAASDEKAK